MNEKIETFTERFNYALDYYGIRPVDFAKRTNLSKAMISQYMSGRAKPKQDRLLLFANTLTVEPAWLMGYDVPMKKVVDTPEHPTLTNDELNLVENYRLLSNKQKEIIDSLIDEFLYRGI